MTEIKEREIRVKIPEGMELSEEEINNILSATKNEIVDVIEGTKAKELVAGQRARNRSRAEVAKERVREIEMMV